MGLSYVCVAPASLVCFLVADHPQVSLTPAAGKLIYLSSPFTVGGGRAAADAACDASKPAGAGIVQALVGMDGLVVADLLVADQPYIRPDGAIVGTGAELIAASSGTSALATGIWQDGAGVYTMGYEVTTGIGGALTTPGNGATTCADWTDAAGQTWIGNVQNLDETFSRWGDAAQTCATARPLYCVEQ